MLCQRCLKKTARHHSPKIVNNEVVHVHLCEDCAERKSEHESSNGLDEKLNHLFDGLIRTRNGENGPAADTHCAKCGTTYKEYRRVHLFGCSNCYEVFSRYLSKENDGSKVPFSRQTRSDGFANQLIFLRNELKKAVEAEDFERAAELRDKIQRYETRGVTGDN